MFQLRAHTADGFSGIYAASVEAEAGASGENVYSVWTSDDAQQASFGWHVRPSVRPYNQICIADTYVVFLFFPWQFRDL